MNFSRSPLEMDVQGWGPSPPPTLQHRGARYCLPFSSIGIIYHSVIHELNTLQLKQQVLMTLLFLWVGNPGSASLGLLKAPVSHRLQSGGRPGLQAHAKAQPREAALLNSFTWLLAGLGSLMLLARGLPQFHATSPLHRPAHNIAAGFHQNKKEGKREMTVFLSPHLRDGIHHFGHILFVRSKPFVLAHTQVEAIAQGWLPGGDNHWRPSQRLSAKFPSDPQ